MAAYLATATTTGGRGASSGGGRFRQAYDLVEALGEKVEGVMKCAVNVADDMQEEGEEYGRQVDKIEEYLLEFARLSEDVNLRKKALEKVSASELPEEEEPSDLSRVFLDCLAELKGAQRASYDPRAHPILQDFSERVRAEEEEEGGEEGGDEGGMEEEGLVVEQVDKSLKCPITKAYFEEPVTSKVCKHSYSKAAIIAQIRQRPNCKCPVCGKPVREWDLAKDKKLEKQVRKAKKQKSSLPSGVVKL